MIDIVFHYYKSSMIKNCIIIEDISVLYSVLMMHVHIILNNIT